MVHGINVMFTYKWDLRVSAHYCFFARKYQAAMGIYLVHISEVNLVTGYVHMYNGLSWSTKVSFDAL